MQAVMGDKRGRRRIIEYAVDIENSFAASENEGMADLSFYRLDRRG